MNPMENAYTDRDIRDTPSLEAIAEEYVQRYTGSFELILDCRDRLRDGYRLGVSQVRAVLNTMRADPRVRQLPMPSQRSDDVEIARGPRLTDNVILFPRRERVRPVYIELPARWKHDFGMSTHRRAEVIHKMAHYKCSLTYFPHATQHQFHDRFRVRIAWACGSALPSVRNRNSSQYTEEWLIRLLTTDQAIALLQTNARRMCPQCDRIGE